MNNPKEKPGGVMPQELEKPPQESKELWFRSDIFPMLEKHGIHATVRLGDRTFGSQNAKGGYQQGSFITLRIVEEDGQLAETAIVAVISSLAKKKFADLDETDFAGTPDSPEKLQGHYGTITSNQDCTVVRFEYLDELHGASDLVRIGTLQPASQPADNPAGFAIGDYTAPLIEHDYPAKTPAMWNAAYRAFKIPEQNIMLVGDPANTAYVLQVLKNDPDYKGGGAGVGFKDETFPHLDELDPLAQAIGSVNFIRKTADGKLRGYNTDGIGYAMSLEQILSGHKETLKSKKILILGAGGTANAIAFALAEKGAELVILNRSVDKAQSLASRINTYFKKNVASAGGEESIAAAAAASDVILNVSTKGAAGALEKYSALAPANLPATPENIGQNLQTAQQLLESLQKNKIISDVILSKQTTPLLRSAAEHGFEILDGVPMVINQGVEAFWLLYGAELDKQGISKDRVQQVMEAAAKA